MIPPDRREWLETTASAVMRCPRRPAKTRGGTTASSSPRPGRPRTRGSPFEAQETLVVGDKRIDLSTNRSPGVTTRRVTVSSPAPATTRSPRSRGGGRRRPREGDLPAARENTVLVSVASQPAPAARPDTGSTRRMGLEVRSRRSGTSTRSRTRTRTWTARSISQGRAGSPLEAFPSSSSRTTESPRRPETVQILRIRGGEGARLRLREDLWHPPPSLSLSKKSAGRRRGAARATRHRVHLPPLRLRHSPSKKIRALPQRA